MTTISRELNEIQAIVRGMRRPISYARFLYVRINNQTDGRTFLRQLGDPTSIEDANTLSDNVFLNIAFTRLGLKNLGVSLDVLATFPEEFMQGMEYRADDNGDVGTSHPNKWDSYWKGRGIDIWIGLYSRVDQNALIARANAIKADIAKANLDVNIEAEQEASRNYLNNTQVFIDDPASQPAPDRKMVMEHFGFHDSVTTPAIKGIWDDIHPSPSSNTRVAGNGKYENGEWQPLAAGEFVLGHIDEVDEIPIAPQPILLSHNGSFMVLRKLYQHVDLFRKYTRQIAAQSGVTADYIAQKMIGRRRDGSNFLDPYRINNFVYKDDMAGNRCPLGAHIRRANPRDTLDFESLLVNRHRIARRAYGFGNLIPRGKTEAQVNPQTGQGLIFIAIGASIERQFEFVQRQWINFGNDLDQGDDRDPVVGDNDASPASKMVIPANAWNEPGGQDPVYCSSIPRFVDTKGGDYFFLPSISAIRALQKGSFVEPEFSNN